MLEAITKLHTDLWFYKQWLDFVQELVSILGATLLTKR